MFVELIESLRCPRAHEEAPLIAAATRSEARHIIDGTLGCPICGAEFAIRDGVARFDDAPPPAEDIEASAEIGMRVAAFLELTDPRGFAVLSGSWGAHADHVRRLADTPLVLLNPPESAERLDVSAILRIQGRLPFAAGSVRAMALEASNSPEFVVSGVEALRTGGRLLAPVQLALPAGISELVRDDRHWVGEKSAASAGTPRLVALKRSDR